MLSNRPSDKLSNLRPSRQTPSSRLRISFEFFPPKTPEMEQRLWESIQRLAPFHPEFVSVTYGAGGTTRERTHATLKRILEETCLCPAAHLTCVGASQEQVLNVVKDYQSLGVNHIVALRGDSPEGLGAPFQAHPQGYRYSSDLVAAISRQGEFEISVAAYPEKHPESNSFDQDIDILKCKIDSGASRAITQFFFDNEMYWRYLERVHRAGLSIPIVPGIVPVHNFQQIAQFAAKTGSSIPSWLAKRFEGLDQDPVTRNLVAAAVAAEQVLELFDQGVHHFHFYTMNKSELVYAICHLLGLRAVAEQKAA